MNTINAAQSSVKPRQRLRKYMLAREQKTIDKAMEILGNYMRGPSCIFTTPDAVKQYLCLHLGNLPHEAFGVLFLDP